MSIVARIDEGPFKDRFVEFDNDDGEIDGDTAELLNGAYYPCVKIIEFESNRRRRYACTCFYPKFSLDDAEYVVLQRRADLFKKSKFWKRWDGPLWWSREFDRYVAFWQAWSVPTCDDLRRMVVRFLVTL